MSAAISLFLFGAITAALSLQLPLGVPRMPGTGFFPLVLGLALMALAAGHGVKIYRARPKAAAPQTPAAPRTPAAPQTPAAPAAPGGDGATRRVVLFIAGVIAAVALLQPLGYVFTSFLLMLLLLRILGLHLWHSVAIALLSAAACYVVFVHWLHIPLPSGWLF